jgi:hypothetical protein
MVSILNPRNIFDTLMVSILNRGLFFDTTAPVRGPLNGTNINSTPSNYIKTYMFNQCLS